MRVELATGLQAGRMVGPAAVLIGTAVATAVGAHVVGQKLRTKASQNVQRLETELHDACHARDAVAEDYQRLLIKYEAAMSELQEALERADAAGCMAQSLRNAASVREAKLARALKAARIDADQQRGLVAVLGKQLSELQGMKQQEDRAFAATMGTLAAMAAADVYKAGRTAAAQQMHQTAQEEMIVVRQALDNLGAELDEADLKAAKRDAKLQSYQENNAALARQHAEMAQDLETAQQVIQQLLDQSESQAVLIKELQAVSEEQRARISELMTQEELDRTASFGVQPTWSCPSPRGFEADCNCKESASPATAASPAAAAALVTAPAAAAAFTAQPVWACPSPRRLDDCTEHCRSNDYSPAAAAPAVAAPVVAPAAAATFAAQPVWACPSPRKLDCNTDPNAAAAATKATAWFCRLSPREAKGSKAPLFSKSAAGIGSVQQTAADCSCDRADCSVCAGRAAVVQQLMEVEAECLEYDGSCYPLSGCDSTHSSSCLQDSSSTLPDSSSAYGSDADDGSECFLTEEGAGEADEGAAEADEGDVTWCAGANMCWVMLTAGRLAGTVCWKLAA